MSGLAPAAIPSRRRRSREDPAVPRARAAFRLPKLGTLTGGPSSLQVASLAVVADMSTTPEPSTNRGGSDRAPHSCFSTGYVAQGVGGAERSGWRKQGRK